MRRGITRVGPAGIRITQAFVIAAGSQRRTTIAPMADPPAGTRLQQHLRFGGALRYLAETAAREGREMSMTASQNIGRRRKCTKAVTTRRSDAGGVAVARCGGDPPRRPERRLACENAYLIQLLKHRPGSFRALIDDASPAALPLHRPRPRRVKRRQHWPD